VKWGGAAVSVLLVAVWIATEIWSFGWGGPPGRAIYFSGGQLLSGQAYAAEGGRDWGIDTTFPVPLWLPAIAVLIPTTIAWRLDSLARRRARLNFCPKCSYDRTGLAAGAVCPECGSKAGGGVS